MSLVDSTGRITDPYRNFIHVSRYARWRDQDNRRETWAETVDRYMGFMRNHLKVNQGYDIPVDQYDKVRSFILNHKALPSMRALMTAGPALERNNVAGYNCSYVVMDNPVAFDETLYILMNGTGVGFSAESVYTSKLPSIPAELAPSLYTIKVGDSKEGWAYALRELIHELYAGEIPTWDTSGVRPAGSRLKTFGGRSSGPEPLEGLFQFVVDLFTKAAGRQLTPLEVHDLVCKIASVVVVGGVRRSALISLGDLEDPHMRGAKSGEWWENFGHRGLANNSAVYDSRPPRSVFESEWESLVASGSGERGIFNREASQRQASRFGKRDANVDYGTNPCSEIILMPNQFCNLSTIVVHADDTEEDLFEKAEIATILGTWQSTLTNFKYLRPEWRENTEKERLLGVSMTGIFGNTLLNGKARGLEGTGEFLTHLRNHVTYVNAREADAIGIPHSAAATCVKPEGTTSQKTNTSSGGHPWHDDQYERTTRQDIKDPVTTFMIDAGFPHEPDVTNPEHTMVFSWPIKAPEGAITRKDITAIDHLEMWMVYQRDWCEHKPSVTITVKSHEWDDVREWVWEHFDDISGVSFLPYSDHTYQQAPYQDLTPAQYDDLVARMPKNVDWSLLSVYETEDQTTSVQDLACVAGGCEVPDGDLLEEAVEEPVLAGVAVMAPVFAGQQ